jgi:hypothetical protein
MSYHPEDNTMDVIERDGTPARRRVECVRREPFDSHFTGKRHFMQSYEPVLGDEETCLWFVGSDVPQIVPGVHQ